MNPRKEMKSDRSCSRLAPPSLLYPARICRALSAKDTDFNRKNTRMRPARPALVDLRDPCWWYTLNVKVQKAA